jgi:hypothetical protein
MQCKYQRSHCNYDGCAVSDRLHQYAKRIKRLSSHITSSFQNSKRLHQEIANTSIYRQSKTTKRAILSLHFFDDIVTASPGENNVVPDPGIVDNVYGPSCERMRSVHAC